MIKAASIPIHLASRRRVLAMLGAGATLPLISWRKALAVGPIRIRGLFETPVEEPFVTQIHKALQKLAADGRHDYKASESVKAADYSRVLRSWCEEGVELIVGDAYGTEQICRRAAKTYPETAFVMGSALGPVEPNFSTFYGVNNESAFLAGMLAGGMSKSGHVGAVAGVAVPSTYALLNAFRAGAREVKPETRFAASFIGSFFDPPKAKESALAMADQGVDVVFAERVGVIEAASERGILAVGNMTDQSAIAPSTVITSAMWDPTPILAKAIESVTAGGAAAADYGPMEVLATGANYLAPFSDKGPPVPPELAEKITKRADDIRSGTLKVPYDEAETASD